MYIYRFFAVVLGLFMFAGLVCAAPVPDQSSSIATNPNWVVVNHQATITIVAHNVTDNLNIKDAAVTVALDNPTLGSLVMTSTTTDASGTATGTFTAGTKSGSVNITATITKDGYSVTKTITQNIDHDVAYTVLFDYDSEVTVGTETPFQMHFTDRWGNPIDNRNPNKVDAVSLSISSVTGAAAFDNGGSFVQDLTGKTDNNGNVTVTVRTDIAGGQNVIWMKGFGQISDQYKSIFSETDGVPFSMILSLTAPTTDTDGYPAAPCDGVANFTFVYTLYDKYGNIAKNQSILLHTTWPGDSNTTYTSNDVGQVRFTYGPHETAAEIAITATAVANTSVSDTTTIRFYSTAPVNMQLMASPQTMGSLDADNTLRSNVSAEVTDIMGNPVKDEEVTFTIGTPWYDGNYNTTYTAGPKWESTATSTTTAVTSVDGFATANFMPGSFDRNATDLNYTQQATGHVLVTARWSTVTRMIQLNWKNYPYLSVDTSVNPSTIGVNGTVDLTIKLKGDGWALQPKPIDVLLLLDNSGSMGTATRGITGTSNVDKSKAAAYEFVNKMTQGTDRVGVIFYDKGTYPDFSVYKPLTLDLTSVKYAISQYSRSNTNGYHTRTRYSLYEAITLMSSSAWQNNNPNAVRAIILMTDGDWSMEGDPLARNSEKGFDTSFTGSETAIGGLHSVWAGGGSLSSNNEYRYFDDLGGGTKHTTNYITDIPGGQKCDNGYAPSSSWCNGWSQDTYQYNQLYSSGTVTYYTDAEYSNQNLSRYASANNVRIYTIGFGNSPSTDTTNVLKILANATGGYYQDAPDPNDLNELYTNIAGDLKKSAGVNTTMQATFDNVNVSGVTFPGGDVYQYIYDPAASTKIIWQDGVTNVTNQTADWNDDHKLDFDIGTITINQVWQADMLFNITKAGNIEVFSGSSVIFNNGADSMALPVKYINVIADLTNYGPRAEEVYLTNLVANPTGERIVDSLPVTWNLTYSGTDTVTERIFWSNDNKQSWQQFATYSGIAPCTDSPQSVSLDVRSLPEGTYWIRVVAQSGNGGYAEQMTSAGIDIGMSGKSYIKLE